MIFDAEHFFDGYRREPRVRARVPRARPPRPAPTLLCLCDTRGGTLPAQVAAGVDAARGRGRGRRSASTATTTAELAVANSLAARRARLRRRCRARSTASASAAATPTCARSSPTLQLKLGYDVRHRRRSSRSLAELSHFVYELANLRARQAPGVRRPERLRPQGRAARRRRAARTPRPTSTSTRRWSATASACWSPTSPGAPTSLYKAKRVRRRPRQRRAGACSALLDELKELEARGYQFEGADASFELLHAARRSTATGRASSG